MLPKEESSSVRNYMFNRLIPYLTDVDSSLHANHSRITRYLLHNPVISIP